ncbi:MAG TPA: class I SAM-dependent rRNA methyltransferase [Flavobacteriales bacterium]|nr:class I SAM-dependent rRNA methyltransferase [Flavobacteriales bacterium]HRJ34408.1 class I SAM-dependent rRNA methyltransferase [Flavobacteriales bacterium]HRJ39914.1 class I SAM-dependent rRNA methyltransferase [Flavobacteriales bacterium]
MTNSIIQLKPGKEKSLERFHPWVFSGAIHRIDGQPEEGEMVMVCDRSGKTLGYGHFQTGSISIRMLQFGETRPDGGFWKAKIAAAWNMRNAVCPENTNVFRLIHGEGDGLPGLVIDYYAGYCIVQCHSIGMYKQRSEIVEALKAVVGNSLKGIYDKSTETLPKTHTEGTSLSLYGDAAGSTEVMEYGHRFVVDWESGQKTGFFIDQRENRKLLGSYAKGKKILNTFCYSGGFSVYALNEGAREVHSLDSSKKAIELTDKNIALTAHADKHKSIVADAIPYIRNIENDYDIIVLDPPAFAKHLSAKHNAIQGYRRLNEEAIRQIKPGGLLFTFSCSQVISMELFTGAVFSASANAKRNVRILHRLHQPADHPVSIFHPEGEYLKGLVLYIE